MGGAVVVSGGEPVVVGAVSGVSVYAVLSVASTGSEPPHAAASRASATSVATSGWRLRYRDEAKDTEVKDTELEDTELEDTELEDTVLEDIGGTMPRTEPEGSARGVGRICWCKLFG